MNNSSAYNNLLLKSIQTQAAPTQAPPVPKRNYQDDRPASFQQSFKDAHDSARVRDDKMAKPVAAKKAVQADNRKPANEVEKKASTPATQADKNSPRNQVAENEKTTDSNESLANQNSDNKGSVDKESESKSTSKKGYTDEEPTIDAGNLLTNTNMPAPLPVVSAEAIVAAQTPVAVEGDTQLETTNEFSTDVLSNSVAVDSGVSVAQVVKGGASNLTNNIQTETDKPSLETDGEPVAPDGDVSALITQPLAVDTLLPQTFALVPILEVVTEQAPAVLAAAGSAVLPKPVLAQSASTPVTDNIFETDVLNISANPLTTEKSSAKASVASDLGLAATSDTKLAQAQILDPKSSFEKMLQNVVNPESSTREENAALPAVAQTSTSAQGTTNTLDSMQRFSDAQTPAARSFVVQTAVPIPVGQPQWSQAVGEKVLWLAAQNVSSAEIHLNPEGLGPMQVKVSVNQEQTTINFTSHHAVVREVLDQNLGRLRDLFSEQGLNLVNVDVSDKSFSRQQGEAKDQKGQTGNNDVNTEDESLVAISTIVQQRLVDHYA